MLPLPAARHLDMVMVRSDIARQEIELIMNGHVLYSDNGIGQRPV
jgi:hypothetical protein